MKTALRREGDKFLLEIDQETFESWAIDPDSSLEVSAMGGILSFFPADSSMSASNRLEAILNDLAVRYDESLKKLAK